jgi:hypothetical protein
LFDKEELERIAAAYVSHYSSPHVWTEEQVLVKRDNSATSWAVDKVFDIEYEQPELLLDFVLQVLALKPSVEVIEVLSAGPLEDYLGKLGQQVINQVEVLAKSNPDFAKLLGGVWKGRMSDDVWNRVQAVWDRRGWDGIPE